MDMMDEWDGMDGWNICLPKYGGHILSTIALFIFENILTFILM